MKAWLTVADNEDSDDEGSESDLSDTEEDLPEEVDADSVPAPYEWSLIEQELPMSLSRVNQAHASPRFFCSASLCPIFSLIVCSCSFIIQSLFVFIFSLANTAAVQRHLPSTTCIH